MRPSLILALAVAVCGCRQLLGFESTEPLAPHDDALIDTTIDALDAPIDQTLGVMVVFQQGLGGYAGVRDTWIDGGGIDRSGEQQLRYRSDQRYALIAFDNLFGGAADQIPPGATIQDAKLFVDVTQNNATGDLFEISHAWAATVVSANFGAVANVDAADDLRGAAIAPLPTVSGMVSMTVTSSLASWSQGLSANEGWIFVATNGGGDSQIRSSEDSQANRPRLEVTYSP